MEANTSGGPSSPATKPGRSWGHRAVFGTLAFAVLLGVLAVAVALEAARRGEPMVLARLGSEISGIAVLPDGRTFVAATEHGEVVLARLGIAGPRSTVLRKGDRCHVTGYAASTPLALSPDGRLAFGGGSCREPGRLMRLAGGGDAGELAAVADAAAFSPGSQVLALAVPRFARVDLFDVRSGERLRSLDGLPGDRIRCLCFDRAGRRLAFGGFGDVAIVDVAGVGSTSRFHIGNLVRYMAFVPHRQQILVATLRTIEVRDTATWASVAFMKAERCEVDAAALSTDGRVVVISTYPDPGATDEVPRIEAWSVEEGSRIWSKPAAQLVPSLVKPPRLRSLAFSPDGDSCIAGTAQGELVRFPVPRGP